MLCGMAHPDLESARLKRDRAREHIENLKTEQERWGKAHPQPFTWVLKEDVRPDRIVGVIDWVDEPPGYMSTVVGDIVQNLRSSLDHIAWQLVQHGTRVALKPREQQQVQFPIYSTLDEFNANRERRIPGVLGVHESIVRRYQPYERGAALAANHPFAVLEGLSNTDKHRNIHLTVWCGSKATFEETKRPLGCLIKEMVSVIDLYDPLKVGTQLFYVTVANRSHCRGIEVQAKLVYQIALEDGVWVHERVSQMEQLVSDLLAEVDGVL